MVIREGGSQKNRVLYYQRVINRKRVLFQQTVVCLGVINRRVPDLEGDNNLKSD